MLLDFTNVETTDNFSVLPEGKYVCNVTGAEVKDTKSGTGKYIKTEFTIVDGAAKGRKIFSQFNIKNDNPVAVAVGMKQLNVLLVNANCQTQKTTTVESVIEALSGKTVGVKTKVTSSTEYGDKAEVHYFYNAKNTQTPSSLSESLPF